jgi:mono/diheme cytochrome c family protein
MLNLIGLAALLAIAAFLVWSSTRAWRFKNSFLKWGGVGVTGLLAAAFLSVSLLAIAGLYKLHMRSAPVQDLKVAGTPEQIQRGHALADSFCGACHSKTGTLTGGMDVGEHLPMPLGSFVSANLTPAGRVSRWSDGDIFRAIRNGVDADGHWLMIMSYTNAGKLSDEDTQALIAYIRSQPAAGQATVDPPDRLNLLGLIMLGGGLLPSGKPVFTGVNKAPPKGPTFKYGEYILSYQDCRECHGADLTGGVPGQIAPIGPDLSSIKEWKREEFIETMRTGTDPDGHVISERMPWRAIGKMDDEELGAVYEYLTHLPGSQTTATN